MDKYLPMTILCANDSCPMASQCLRYTRYLEARATELSLQILNTSLLNVTDEGCEYIHIPRTEMQARGFEKMYGSVPRRAAINLWRDFPRCGSRRQFYRLLNGEVALNIDHQEEIKSFFESLGADTSLGFDKYEEVTV